jgi:hypothetical protein
MRILFRRFLFLRLNNKWSRVPWIGRKRTLPLHVDEVFIFPYTYVLIENLLNKSKNKKRKAFRLPYKFQLE